MKRSLLVLLIVAVFMTVAPTAMADHCVTCRNLKCSIAFTGGYLSCTQLANGCSLSGGCGGPHPFTEEEFFATEFTVASVDRLDEPQQPAANETRVASAETETPRTDVRR